MKKSQLNMEISSKLRTSKDITFLAVALLLAVVALYSYAGPAYVEGATLENENAAKETDLKNKRELLRNIQSFNEENADLSTNSKKLSVFIPSRKNYEDFFAHVMTMAEANNLDVTSFGLSESKTSSPTAPVETADAAADGGAEGADGAAYAETRSFKLNQQEVAIEMTGDFENMMNFMKALENGIPFIQEVSLDLSPQSTESVTQAEGVPPGPVMLDASMSFNFYYY